MGHLVSPLVPTSALGAGAPTLVVCALAISASPPRRSDRRDHPRHRLPSRHPTPDTSTQLVHHLPFVLLVALSPR